jgi:hypothetical protein
MIAVGMCQHNRAGPQPTDTAQPVRAAIDHRAYSAVRDQCAGMPLMTTASRVDVTSSAEKRQRHPTAAEPGPFGTQAASPFHAAATPLEEPERLRW